MWGTSLVSTSTYLKVNGAAYKSSMEESQSSATITSQAFNRLLKRATTHSNPHRPDVVACLWELALSSPLSSQIEELQILDFGIRILKVIAAPKTLSFWPPKGFCTLTPLTAPSLMPPLPQHLRDLRWGDAQERRLVVFSCSLSARPFVIFYDLRLFGNLVEGAFCSKKNYRKQSCICKGMSVQGWQHWGRHQKWRREKGAKECVWVSDHLGKTFWTTYRLESWETWLECC